MAGSRERFWYGVIRGASQPEDAVHSMESIWSKSDQYAISHLFSQLLESSPVNVRPKMRSSLGSTVLGVIVSVISSFEGSIPGSFDAGSSSRFNASLFHRDVENVLCESNSGEANGRSGRVLQRNSRGRSILRFVGGLSGQHEENRGWNLLRRWRYYYRARRNYMQTPLGRRSDSNMSS